MLSSMTPTLRVLLFLATAGLLFAALGTHVLRRVMHAFALTPRVRRVLWVLLGLGILATLLGRLLGNEAPSLARALGMFGSVVSLSVVISSILLWPYEVVRGLLALARRVQNLRSAPPTPPASPGDAPSIPERRDFLTQAIIGGTAALGTGTASYGTLFGRHDYQLEFVSVALAKLPSSLEGLRIAQISDIHVGLFVNELELSRGLTLIRQARPDVIVMTGDLVDHDIRYAPMLARFARKLEGIARYGVHAIPGNHDHYAGVQVVYQVLGEAGVEVLLNRHVRIGDGKHAFALAGVDDVVAKQYGGAGPDLVRAFEGASPDLARVLLSHNPSFFPQARDAADLVLSGHTHGGQITLFVNPAELVLRHGYIRGLYHDGETQLYVNRGFGTAGPPARFGSAPEITCLTLTRA